MITSPDSRNLCQDVLIIIINVIIIRNFTGFISSPSKCTLYCSILFQGCTDFPNTNWQPPKNSGYQKGDMKQVPHCGLKNIRRHRKKLSHPGNLVHGYSARLFYLSFVSKSYKLQSVLHIIFEILFLSSVYWRWSSFVTPSKYGRYFIYLVSTISVAIRSIPGFTPNFRADIVV